MSTQPHNRDSDIRRTPTNSQRGLEMAIFILASVVGIYGIGKGLAGFYERGQEINLLWLAVTGVAFFVLFAQMGRVHDTWPQRPSKITSRTPHAPVKPDDESPDADRPDADRK